MSHFSRCIFVSMFLVTGFTSYSQNIIKWVSWSELGPKIEKADKKFMVYLYYDGCKWCRIMEQQTFTSDQIARFVNANYYPLKLNAIFSGKIVVADKTYKSVSLDKYEFSELAVELAGGEMNFPNVVFLDEKFNKIQSLPEYMEVPYFEMVLSYFAGNHHQKTLFKRFANSYCKDSHFNSLVNGRRN
ncbi:MAG: DUF255 domain-containing protein [Saprospiraceae bacterium]|jgi:thioredoxin-related protein|nr:DUF255 domain-containing protein [Saprospiraceae bacterium]